MCLILNPFEINIANHPHPMRTGIVLIIIFFCLSVAAQPIVINEFMASNATSATDEDGDTEDWIELYNNGNESVNLMGWGISDNYTQPFKWVFPDVEIHPGEYLLVWASGKDRTGEHLHTNFSISSDGEELILVSPEGNWADEFFPLVLPTDISYGRYPNGTDDFYFFIQSTPGQPNEDNGYEELLPPPVFSHASGFYTDTFYLKVFHPDPYVELRYTTDGSFPTLESEIFPDSLLIYNRKNDPDVISAIPTTPLTAPAWFRWYPPMDIVFKGTNLRVRAFKDEALSPFTETRTYWVDPDIHSRYSLPVVSLSIQQDALFGTTGIYTNFNQRGPAWERDMHIAFFEPNGTPGFATDAGVRIHGGNSRRYMLKSFRVYFRNKYGDSQLNYPLFEGQDMNIHDRLIMRNGGSDFSYTYFRDAFVQSILKGFSDVETQAYQPAITFLNSEYWGILNFRERYDNKYIENHYGYTDFDMLDNTGQVTYGSNAHYQNLISFLHNNSLESEENYEWVKSRMDVEDFRDYHILQVFSMNTDQPGKNVRFWRPRTEDGKWRWMWWDMDDSFIFGPHNNYDRNALVFCTGLDSINDPTVNPATPPPAWAPNGPVQTFPLRALLGSPWFRADFINRFADLLNTAFQPDYLISIVDEFDNKVGPYMNEHYRRWHRPAPAAYQQHVQHLRNFSAHRIHYMREHIVHFFELEGTFSLEANIGSGKGHIRVNTLDLTTELPSLSNPVYPWSGEYFKGIPVEVEAIPAPGYKFSHWEGDSDANTPLITVNSGEDVALIAHFTSPEEKDIITFWYFNTELPNNTPLKNVEPWFSLAEGSNIYYHSALEGYPFDEHHPFWRKASLERRNHPTPVNYREEAMEHLPYDAEDMRGIQVKQPFQVENRENTLIFHLPTTDFEDIIFSCAVLDEGAAEAIILDYSTEEAEVKWTNLGLSAYMFTIEDQYSLIRVDFAGLEEVDDNADFKIRMRFDGPDLTADDGNRVTLNNIALEGTPHTPVSAPRYAEVGQLNVFPNPVSGDHAYLPETMDIQLFDTQGRLLMNLENTRNIPVAQLPAGIYFVRNQKAEWAKLVVRR